MIMEAALHQALRTGVEMIAATAKEGGRMKTAHHPAIQVALQKAIQMKEMEAMVWRVWTASGCWRISLETSAMQR
jgi:phosphoheptose isomerase